MITQEASKHPLFVTTTYLQNITDPAAAAGLKFRGQTKHAGKDETSSQPIERDIVTILRLN
ncbi:MAG: hypothetical protein CL862_12020 [Cyanobium sp. NAT70]|nr:hypothetical protein [Cyanobium sp. NAT70]